MKQKVDKSIKFKISQRIASGISINFLRIIASRFEFILDFSKLMPDMEEAHILSRLSVNPQAIKRFSILINKFVSQYEEKFGKIEEDELTIDFKIDTSIKN